MFLPVILSICGRSLAQQVQTADTAFTEQNTVESITFKTGDVRDSIVYYNEKRWSHMTFIPKGNGSMGTWRLYSKKGFKVFEYGVANNQKNGPYFEFYKNGKVRRKEFYVENMRSGNASAYYENGNLRIQCSYYENKLDGTLKHYYSNGNIQWKGDYSKGRMAGERVYYNEDGSLINGPFTIKNDKGGIEREGTCVNGRPEGELKVYDEKGSLVILSNFKNGIANGLTSHYGENQKLLYTELYKNGRFKKETRLDHKIQ